MRLVLDERSSLASQVQDVHEMDAWTVRISLAVADRARADPVLGSLSRLLQAIPSVAQELYPCIVHLALSQETDRQSNIRTELSQLCMERFSQDRKSDLTKTRLLLNTLVYLLKQPIAEESIRNDRFQWLEVDYVTAAEAATRCGMATTALFLIENMAQAEAPSRGSRRLSSANKVVSSPSNDFLLDTFRNIDDPDSFYGVELPADLQSVIARVDHEQDGLKGLALHSARLDASMRSAANDSELDGSGMMRSLGVLNLNSLTFQLLSQRRRGTSDATVASTYLDTARKLDQWDVATPSTADSNDGVAFGVMRSFRRARTINGLLAQLDEGFKNTVASLARPYADVATTRAALRALAVLTSIDEVARIQGSTSFQDAWQLMQERQANWDIGQ